MVSLPVRGDDDGNGDGASQKKFVKFEACTY